ncbi:two component transcriptional regulator, LuxR family [Brevibacterium sp. 239c]|uniref:response regulator n=1 Tax=Brevibacterium sp. 239c TaxID=1965356 RepID=UPI000C5F876C|nr:response regulator transcription factor [Brevibacterium sp. 239c]SMX97491.1 two component transcriptional regulator, LuxR family [Brevibacterium sp. 239c]
MSESGVPEVDDSPADELITVLIVDDDSWTTRAVAAALVDDGGFSVLEPQHSGDDAVEAFDRHRPDLVLMDVNMHPGMSGVDATKEIRSLDPEARIVLLTTVSPGPGITRALEAGAIAAVNKSATDVELVGVARSAAAGESPALLRSLAEDIMISGDITTDVHDAVPELTRSEKLLLTQICEGLDYAEIAEQQVLTIYTVKSHARNLRIKLGAKNLAQVVVRAIQYKFYVPE